jgi:hypothetical protein
MRQGSSTNTLIRGEAARRLVKDRVGRGEPRQIGADPQQHGFEGLAGDGQQGSRDKSHGPGGRAFQVFPGADSRPSDLALFA